MPETRLETTARVHVTVEVSNCGAWGPDCTVEQVQRQAADHATGAIRKILADSGHANRVQIIGEPRVLVVTTERPTR